jgi:hypothetical protein
MASIYKCKDYFEQEKKAIARDDLVTRMIIKLIQHFERHEPISEIAPIA